MEAGDLRLIPNPSGIDFCLYVLPAEPVSLEVDKLLGELRHCCDRANAMDETVT